MLSAFVDEYRLNRHTIVLPSDQILPVLGLPLSKSYMDISTPQDGGDHMSLHRSQTQRYLTPDMVGHIVPYSSDPILYSAGQISYSATASPLLYSSDKPVLYSSSHVPYSADPVPYSVDPVA